MTYSSFTCYTSGINDRGTVTITSLFDAPSKPQQSLNNHKTQTRAQSCMTSSFLLSNPLTREHLTHIFLICFSDFSFLTSILCAVHWSPILHDQVITSTTCKFRLRFFTGWTQNIRRKQISEGRIARAPRAKEKPISPFKTCSRTARLFLENLPKSRPRARHPCHVCVSSRSSFQQESPPTDTHNHRSRDEAGSGHSRCL